MGALSRSGLRLITLFPPPWRAAVIASMSMSIIGHPLLRVMFIKMITGLLMFRRSDMSFFLIRSCRPRKESLGMSFVEMMISMVITSMIVLVIAHVQVDTTKVAVKTRSRSSSNINILAAMNSGENCLLNANSFDLAVANEVIFMADLCTDPDYQPYGDQDGDGIINIE